MMVDGLETKVPIAEVLGCGYMSNLEYYEQVRVLVDMRNYFGRDKTDIVIELNNTGIVVEEILRRDYGVHCVGIQVV